MYASVPGDFTCYRSVHFNLLESGLTYILSERRPNGKVIRKFIFYYHFPKPMLADINRLKSEPGSGFLTDTYSQNTPQNSTFSKGKNSLLFIFKYFLFNKREGYDYLIYKIDDQTQWSSTALSKSPAILLENLSANKHTLYAKYPAKYAAVFTYDFTITPGLKDSPLWYVLLSIVLSGIIFFFIFRTRLKRAKEKALTTKLELQAIQAQLNPHFMFNALGPIQYLVNSVKK